MHVLVLVVEEGSGCGRGLKQQKLENPTIKFGDLKNICMKHEDLSKNVAGVSFTFGNLACLYVFFFLKCLMANPYFCSKEKNNPLCG